MTDKVFVGSVQNTLIVVVLSVMLCLPLSFLLALMLNLKMKCSGLIRVLNFTPNVIAAVIVGMLWVFILDVKIGFLNNILGAIGLPSNTQWIGGSVLSPYSFAFVDSWRGAGFYAVVILAGMKLIPDEIYESAQIDGANALKRLFYITIPMLKETIKICLVLIISGGFKTFEIPWALTGGGPFHKADTITTYLYHATNQTKTYGYGMSIAIVLFIITMTISVIFLRLTSKNITD